MAVLTSAESYFREIEAQHSMLGWIEARLDRKEQEEEWLEFKGCISKDPKTKEACCITDRDVKEYWSQALSGFANTGGGVLVWGLDARKNDDDVDCVTALAPHENAVKLAERLKELLPHAVDPPISGVRIEHTVKDAHGAGYVVCFIPEGKVKPHRAEQAGHNYYVRIGTSFKIPPVPLLRSLFFPAAGTALVPRLKVLPDDDRRLVFQFSLENNGILSAYESFIRIELPNIPFMPLEVATVTHRRLDQTIWGFDAHRPFHPQTYPLVVANLVTRMDHMLATMSIRLSISCKDTPLRRWKGVVEWDELANPVDFVSEDEL